MTLTEEFARALQVAEESGDVSGLLALHAGDVTLRNLTQQTWEGVEGARAFWEAYLGSFEVVHSEFSRVQEVGGLGVLEWVASGRLPGGREFSYRGVSLLDVQGGKVGAFRTYYDSAAFVVATPA